MNPNPKPKILNPKSIAYLGLGSSLGDHIGYLQQALDRLEDPDKGLHILAVSPVYESPHMGLQPGDEWHYPPHLNIVAQIATTLSPDALLSRVQAVEAAGLRRRDERWGPRTIDIDILLYGDIRVDTDLLRVPHPEMTRRAFVMRPLVDLAPDLRLPGGSSVREIAQSAPIRAQRIEPYSQSLRLPKSREEIEGKREE